MVSTDPVLEALLKGQTNLSFYVLSALLGVLAITLIVSQQHGKGFRIFGRKVVGRNGWKDDLGVLNPDWGKLPQLEAIPGPSSWDPTGIIGNMFQLFPFESALSTGLKWSAQYGDIFKVTALTQTYVGLNSAPAIQTMLKSSDMGHLEKALEMYNPMKPFITNGVLVSRGAFWQHERKILTKFQTYQNLRNLMPMLNRHCKEFISGLESLFKDGKPHPMNDLICSCFLKVISEVITGFHSEGSKDDEFIQYNNHIQSWKTCLPYHVLPTWFLFTPLWKLHPLSRKYDKANDGMFEFTRKRILEHKQKRTELETKNKSSQGPTMTADPIKIDNDFRSVLDDLVDGGVEEGQIVDEINTMTLGGYETGATAIHFLFFYLALNPEIQKECQKEIDELFEDPQRCQNGAVMFDAVSSGLKLVERCILETLRLRPSIYAFTRKLDDPLKINCDGKDILLPVGTNVIISPFIVHRKSEYFPEPETFNPDRFLPEVCAKRHAYAYIPFSAGPRNCLGMKFGMIEMKTIAAHTLRHFFLKTDHKMEDIPLLPYIILTPAKDYTFQLVRREEISKH